MGETLWQKAYDEYVQDKSYQGKLKKENDKLKAKLEKIEQVVNQWNDRKDADAWAYREIKKVLEKE